MRILQLVKRRQFRGAEVFAVELCDALAARGHEVLLVGLLPAVHDALRPQRAGAADLGHVPRGPLDPRSVRSLSRLMADFGPDLVQANGSDTMKYSVAARLAGHGSWPIVYRNIGLASDWVRPGLHRAFQAFIARRVDLVASVSRASASDFAATYGYPSERIEVIPQSASVPVSLDPAAARARLVEVAGLTTDAEILVHVGSFTREKNHAWLVEQFGRLAALRPEARLVLIGDGPERPAVESACRGTGVVFLGVRSDAAELAGGADVLVLPSLTEGLPGVVLEAGARGVPTVATAVGGVPEIVRDGETGLLTAPGDADGFVAALSRLLSEPDFRRSMGLAARALVAAEYDFDRAVERYETVYARLVAPNAA